MTDGVKGSRPYRSALREEAAGVTRRRIREAAAALFIDQGFVATTMRQVAERAGVAERTVYAAFPAKAQLFDEVVSVAIVGDERPVPVIERAEVQAVLAEHDGRRALALIVDYSVALHERAAPLIMAGELSSGADPDMRRFSEMGSAAMRSDMGAVASALAGHRALGPRVDAERAADILFVLLSPYTWRMARQLARWPVDRYRAWIFETLAAQLLAD